MATGLMMGHGQRTGSVVFDYDSEGDVFYLSRVGAPTSTWNVARTANITERIDVDTNSVVGVIVTNFSSVLRSVYRLLMEDKGNERYLKGQFEIVLDKLTERIRTDYEARLRTQPAQPELSALIERTVLSK